MSIFSSTMPAVAPRLTITSLRAKLSKIVGAVALHAAFEHRPLLLVELAGEDRRQRGLEVVERDVGDEAEPALVDADQRRAVAGEPAGDAEHGAVAAEDDGDVAGGAERVGVEHGVGVDAGVGRGLFLDRDRDPLVDEEAGDLLELFAHAAGLELADERSVPEAGRHSRDYTTATLGGAGENGAPGPD